MKKIIGFCGACIAFYIGAGFATMQEVMQYEASYGSRYWIVVLVTALVYIYTNISFATNGNISKIERGGEIFSLYCGKKIGAFYDAFCAFFCYMCFIVMCGGANSTATEQWNLPNGVGAIILTIAVVATVIMDLDGILKVLNKIGPIIIVTILAIAVISTMRPVEPFQSGLWKIDAQLASVSDWTCSLDDLMAKPYPSSDTSIANQSSIVFTFEYAGIRNLFCGDAWAENIPGGKYDLVKLPHHGSIRNISDALLSRIQADTFLICADGTSHPNKQTIAKLLQQYGNISIYSNYSWWMNGFLMTDDMKYIKNGNLKLLII